MLQRPPFKVKHDNTKSLSLGFVGSLQYKTILAFAEVVGEDYPQHEFQFRGGLKEGPMKASVDRLTNSYENIHYHGAFRNPIDLPIVYDSFDITVSCYQVFSLNERIAEPNKLYESIFLAIQLSFRKELNCGYCIERQGESSGIHRFLVC